MLQGSIKDHSLLSDLLFNQFHTLQKTLINTFDILIESFQSNNPTKCSAYSAKLLECIYIKQKLHGINIKQKYLRTITMGETVPLLVELHNETDPIVQKSLVILSTIISDYTPSETYSKLVNLEFIQSIHLDICKILPSFISILDQFIKFNANCSKKTSFSPSSYSKQEDLVMIVNFDAYDEEYMNIFHELYALQDFLKDLEEGIRKGSPCFKEYTECVSSLKKLDDYDYGYDYGYDDHDGHYLDVFQSNESEVFPFDLDDFEKFSTKRKTKLGIDARRVFSDY